MYIFIVINTKKPLIINSAIKGRVYTTIDYFSTATKKFHISQQRNQHPQMIQIWQITIIK